MAQQRALAQGGSLILRNEDLDSARCKPEFVRAMIEDLQWFGFRWQEGPDCGGQFGPYTQSERRRLYSDAFRKLEEGGFIYLCTCSRQDVQRALQAPHQGEDEPIYPGTCRPGQTARGERAGERDLKTEVGFHASRLTPRAAANWRFRVPDGEPIAFTDGFYGPQQFTSGKDFGDFVVWRHDGIPSYQLAVVVDDAAMRITEVVRGIDLLKSTARQILLYRALGLDTPSFYHCALMTDESGVRLAKRHDARSLRHFRERGIDPESLRRDWWNHARRKMDST
jgi:glutamyl/glutaminyl-tRNA synthetase